MSSAHLVKRMLKQPWLHWDVPFITMYSVFKKITRRDDIHKVDVGEGKDVEIEYYYFRLNDVLILLCTMSAAEVMEEFFRRLGEKRLPVDAYTASQQLCNLYYLYKNLDGDQRAEFAKKFAGALTYRVDYLLSNYEFKTNNNWFTNHLLNNYRALLIYREWFSEACDSECGHSEDRNKALDKVVLKIDAILYRYRASIIYPETLFLSEGSTSYEVIVTKHFFELNLLRCTEGKFLELVKSSLKSHLQAFESLYRSDGEWLFPWFGDQSPDIRLGDVKIFLSSVYDQEKNPYQRVWQDECSKV
ncbi:MAG: hypothetical protein COA42_00465 [Alteromonadaceae bacterium]|nr:MAG: hypothetical protein COA42_00465 [Alteromonadaceae bacterium]